VSCKYPEKKTKLAKRTITGQADPVSDSRGRFTPFALRVELFRQQLWNCECTWD
ncbi:hypothetical protein Angca_000033, partial [Angiostrongylus cantonensis]